MLSASVGEQTMGSPRRLSSAIRLGLNMSSFNSNTF